MANVEEGPTVQHEEETVHAAPAPETKGLGALSWFIRAMARVWVVSMLVLAAGFGGVAVYQFYLSRVELAAVREAPGPQPYAVVAYRRELARQIETYSEDWENWDAVPAPPKRPELMQEIDLVRARNAEIRREAETQRIVRQSGQVAAPR